jgi:hypothetical protein
MNGTPYSNALLAPSAAVQLFASVVDFEALCTVELVGSREVTT